MSFLISSVRRQLIGAFIAVSLVFVIALVIGWSSIGSVNGKVQSGARQLPTLEQATGHARDMVASEVSTVLQPSNAGSHEADVQTFQRTVRALNAYATTPAAKSAINALNAKLEAWQALDGQVVALAKAHRPTAAANLTNGATNNAADALTAAVQNASQAISNANASAAASSASSSRTLMLVIALVALLAAG
ncbi:MAG: hypothetical protein WB761_24975, partial [Solirubrobacteraceae bacterium]